ncbi:fimbrial protein [Kosakonia oryziphila]|uniref:Pilin (Type 1 fimbria component protein) n=1 Tax=Kosakonia oryziphila TaxID=1005667 RepID=A0A1C4GI15_9ENTR|nr:fimbrial protein [Kosakonia oryziphila]SCC67455.1 Pilin (type 1 fimbria component protein) [Kosakonia oryziphila]
MKRKSPGIVCGGLLALAATDARAYQCTRVTASTVLTPPPVTVQRDLPVGALIGSEVVSGVVQTYNCTNSPGGPLTYQEFGVKGEGTYVTTINGRRVYSTNIAGIGYAVGATSVNNCGSTGYVDGTQTGDGNVNNRLLCRVNGILRNQPLEAQARIQFYKTAQTTGTGRVSARQVGSFILRYNQQSWSQLVSTISIAAFNVSRIACTVGNTAISVPMGAVEKRAFSGPGTWPGDASTRSFTIPLNCNAGTRVSLRIDGSAQNATRGVLNLAGGAGSASGVGIQLLYNNAPLPLQTVISTGSAASAGAYNVPLQARYYQTGSDITPGVANASATFTLVYQ